MNTNPEIIAKAIQLLESGHSARSIARLLGISRGSADRIANGKMVVTAAQPPRKGLCPPGMEIGRCRSCGSRVRLPCWACQIRSHKKEPAA